MSETLEELRAKRTRLWEQCRDLEGHISLIDAEILRLETEASPWRVGMVLERSYKTKVRISSFRWEDGPWKTERAVVAGTRLRWGKVEPLLRRLLKDGFLGKQTPTYTEAWKPTGETVDLEES